MVRSDLRVPRRPRPLRAVPAALAKTGEREGGHGRGIAAGLLAGVVGIGCCVGPAVAALVGVTSAAVAIDVANDLYSTWGWAFKILGGISAAGAILLARRRVRTCNIGGRTSLVRYSLVVIGVGLLTYASLYATTTWLGELSASAAQDGPGAR